jgi:hypothetical protein
MDEATEQDERQFACSRCFAIVAESGIHVVPTFNESIGGYVTSFRCEECWQPSLDETAARIAAAENEDEIAALCAFLERHGIFLFEFRRGDALPAVRMLLERALVTMKSGSIRLTPGPLADENGDPSS